MSSPRIDQPFVIGPLPSTIGPVPVVASRLSLSDRLGTVKVRCGVGRSNYRIDPGLYAIGTPDSLSEVLVTANYKLTFDGLRGCLEGRSFWLLVLDTNGVNVWCAAGKGTFGTDELVNRIASSGLHLLVNHRRLIVPQLGAPGISAHDVKKKVGFKVIFGPVECRDLTQFIDNGFKATASMRFKSFDLIDRAVLIPVELFHAIKLGLLITLVSALICGFLGKGFFWDNAIHTGLFISTGLFLGIMGGAILAPLLLPWLPGRSFSAKGLVSGLVLATVWLTIRHTILEYAWSWLEAAAWLLIISSVSSYLALNFTGSSTFTSLSGVRKEMRWAIPVHALGSTAGALAWLGLILTQ